MGEHVTRMKTKLMYAMASSAPLRTEPSEPG